MKTLAPVFVFLLLLLCHSWFGPDIWYHLTWGREILHSLTFTPAQHTLLQQPIYANMYWLFQVIVTALFTVGGVYLTQGFFVLLWIAIALLWLRQTGCRKALVWGPLLFLAFVICMQLRFEPRPEVLSYLFLSLQMWLMQRLDFTRPLDRRTLGFMFLLQVVWTNCHGYFVLGPAMAVALGLSLHGGSLTVARRALLVLIVTLAATLVTPFGWQGWRAVLAYAQISQALRGWNAELMSPPLWAWPWPLCWLLWLAVLVTSVAALWRWKNVFGALLGLAACLIAVQATRNIPLFLILGSPMLGEVLRLWESRWKWGAWPSWLTFAVASALSVTVVTDDYYRSMHSLGSFGIGLEASAFPVRATEFLQEMHFNGRIFVDSYDGGYVEYVLPEATPVGDSYFSDPTLTLQYFAAIRDPRALAEMDRKFAFAALLINVENSDVMLALGHDPQWRYLYLDSHRALFVRNGAFAERTFDLEKMQFYHGEDLRNWADAFGVSGWAKIAFLNQDIPLMRKLLKDTSVAEKEPGTLIGFAGLLAARTGDRELLALVEQAEPKIISESVAEAAQVQQVMEKLSH